MEIDTNWCPCGRAIQSPASASYCSPACEARDKSHSGSQQQQQRQYRQPRLGQPSGLDLDRNDRSAPLYGRSTHFSIDSWRHQVRPLEGVDARYSTGTPASTSLLSLASSPQPVASTSALPHTAWPRTPSPLPLPSRRVPLVAPLEHLSSLYSGSISPPQTAALTTDEESIPTPPSRSEVDQPLAIYTPESRSGGFFNRLRTLTQTIVSSPRPTAPVASFEEVISRSPGKHDTVRRQQPAVAIPIPLRHSPAHKGHYVYRPSTAADSDELDSVPSFRAAPIVSRPRALF